ncbi:hypothetical protein K4F52_007008 [Lecanicillium sp. MT-2017a]|nr:hypothetical protein K4F52_007008 [Lecanicillium sp. MT-2017a]
MHEAAHARIYGDIEYVLRLMGLRQSWRPTGASTMSPVNPADVSSREGDSGGAPHPLRTRPDAWPTLVIETAVSMSLEALRSTGAWWLTASRLQVKIVLLVKIDRQQKRIVLEKIAATGRGVFPLVRFPAITIDMLPAPAATPRAAARADPESYTASGTLRLGFESLFLRSSNARESDVVLTRLMLRELAALIWSLED